MSRWCSRMQIGDTCIVWTIDCFYSNRELQAPDFSQGWLTSTIERQFIFDCKRLFDSGKSNRSVIGAVRKLFYFQKQHNTLRLVFGLTVKRCNLQRCRFDSDKTTSQVKSLAKWRKLSCICLLKAYNRLVLFKVHAGKYFVHLKTF